MGCLPTSFTINRRPPSRFFAPTAKLVLPLSVIFGTLCIRLACYISAEISGDKRDGAWIISPESAAVFSGIPLLLTAELLPFLCGNPLLYFQKKFSFRPDVYIYSFYV